MDPSAAVARGTEVVPVVATPNGLELLAANDPKVVAKNSSSRSSRSGSRSSSSSSLGSEGNVGVRHVDSESGDSIIELQLPRPRYYLSFTPRQYMTVAGNGYINEATSDARRAADSDDSSAGQGAAVAPWEDSSVDSDVPDLLDRTVDDGSVDNDVPDLDEEGIPDLEEGLSDLVEGIIYLHVAEESDTSSEQEQEGQRYTDWLPVVARAESQSNEESPVAGPRSIATFRFDLSGTVYDTSTATLTSYGPHQDSALRRV